MLSLRQGVTPRAPWLQNVSKVTNQISLERRSHKARATVVQKKHGFPILLPQACRACLEDVHRDQTILEARKSRQINAKGMKTVVSEEFSHDQKPLAEDSPDGLVR